MSPVVWPFSMPSCRVIASAIWPPPLRWQAVPRQTRMMFSPRGLRLKQDALQSGVPEGYYRHVGVYGYRADFLAAMSAMKPTAAEAAEQLEQLRILEKGYRIRVVVTDYRAQGVDTKEGLERARQRAEEEG